MSVICPLFQIYILCFMVRAILSWFPASGQGLMGTVNQFLYTVTEPVLRPVRSILPPVSMGGMGLDLSFIVVFFGLILVMQLVC